jgi:hypothetical protein
VISWPDIEIDLRRVLEHPGFVEFSHHAEFDLPWAIGLRLGAVPGRDAISWFSGVSIFAALTQAVCALEGLGQDPDGEGSDMPRLQLVPETTRWLKETSSPAGDRRPAEIRALIESARAIIDWRNHADDLDPVPLIRRMLRAARHVEWLSKGEGT